MSRHELWQWLWMTTALTGTGVLFVPLLRLAGLHSWWSGWLVAGLLFAGYIYGKYERP